MAATLALVFSMSGGALAARHYLISSTKQISPKVLRALKGKPGPPGATGATGASGASGAQGKEGAAGKEGKQARLSEIKEVRGPEVFVKEQKVGTSVAECPKGTRAISGGDLVESEKAAPNIFRSEALLGRKGWVVEIGNPKGTGEEIFVEAVAYCAGEGEAVAG